MSDEAEKQPMPIFGAVEGGVCDDNAGCIYTGPERRRGWHDPGSCVNMRIVEQRFAEGTARMNRMEKCLEVNTQATTEVRDILQLGRSFFRIVDLVGRAVKWVAAIAAPVVALYFAIKGGDAK